MPPDPDPYPRSSFEELFHRLEEAERALTREGAATPEERHKILAERARALAGSTRAEAGAAGFEVLAFRVGGERYAVRIEEVDEVLEVRGLSTLLGAPRHVLGAVAARARVIPVLDLRALLGLEGGGLSDLLRIVAVGRGEDLFGLAVEEIEGRLSLSPGPSEKATHGPFAFVTADRLAVLDLALLGEPGAAAHSP